MEKKGEIVVFEVGKDLGGNFCDIWNGESFPEVESHDESHVNLFISNEQETVTTSLRHHIFSGGPVAMHFLDCHS